MAPRRLAGSGLPLAGGKYEGEHFTAKRETQRQKCGRWRGEDSALALRQLLEPERTQPLLEVEQAELPPPGEGGNTPEVGTGLGNVRFGGKIR